MDEPESEATTLIDEVSLGVESARPSVSPPPGYQLLLPISTISVPLYIVGACPSRPVWILIFLTYVDNSSFSVLYPFHSLYDLERRSPPVFFFF